MSENHLSKSKQEEQAQIIREIFERADSLDPSTLRSTIDYFQKELKEKKATLHIRDKEEMKTIIKIYEALYGFIVDRVDYMEKLRTKLNLLPASHLSPSAGPGKQRFAR